MQVSSVRLEFGTFKTRFLKKAWWVGSALIMLLATVAASLGARSDTVATGQMPITFIAFGDAPAPTTTPTPTVGDATVTLSPTELPHQLIWGDHNCSGSTNLIDSLLTLRFDAGLSADTGECPEMGQIVEVTGASPYRWGDVDCSGAVNPVDALKLLRFDAGLSVAQAASCSDIGSPIGGDIGSSPTVSATPLPTQVEQGVVVIHHIDVEQGDAALIVGPSGESAMIDNGRWTNCNKVVSYVLGAGITQLDHHFATHYHPDHIGCLDDLVDAGVTVGACYDRGGSLATHTFRDYVGACGAARQTVFKGQVISLGAVTIEVIDLNGAGLVTTDENALSLVLKLTYGSFDHVFPGDVIGVDPDVESVIGPEVGAVEVCKVTHHGAKFSSTDAWLDAITPEACILSLGNDSGLPESEVLERLHSHGVELYWTNEGSGAAPGAADHVCGDIQVVAFVSGDFTVEC